MNSNYEYLETIDNKESLQWVESQNKETAAKSERSPLFEKLRVRLLDIFNAPDRIPRANIIGRAYYDFRRNAEHPKGIWCRTSPEQYRCDDTVYGDPEVPEVWESIKALSPYHNARIDGAYPHTLLGTSIRDDRAHPGHARKMKVLLDEYTKQSEN